MKTLLVLVVALAFAAAACDGGDPTTMSDGSEMRGSVGGMTGAGGAAGAAGAYVPDPAPTCGDPSSPAQINVCDAGGGNAPMFDATGTECAYCSGWPVPDTGCAIRIPQAVSGGVIIHGPHDVFCPSKPCDPDLCHVKS